MSRKKRPKFLAHNSNVNFASLVLLNLLDSSIDNRFKLKEVSHIQVSLDASNKEKVILDLLNTRDRLSASASGTIAAAETSDGKRAQVQKIGDRGGIATVDGHKYGKIFGF